MEKKKQKNALLVYNSFIYGGGVGGGGRECRLL